MNFLSVILGRRDRDRELELDAAFAARAMAHRRHQLGREQIKSKARQMRAELGLPELQALKSPARRNPERMKADSVRPSTLKPIE